VIVTRRGFLAGLVLGGGLTRRLFAQQGEQLPGEGESGTLRDPQSAGGSRERATHRDNDPFVTDVEKRLHCTCGCTLDIYTCRTTDFTCSYSPALHKEVLALQEVGKTADEIVAAFVAKYGEKILMAPKPEGFNIAGYVVPGLVVLLVGGVMFAILRQRTRMLEVARAAATPGVPPMPTGAGRAIVAAPPGSAEELDRLARELKESDT
jgi:cytochrome c-type biogenesis protein CcmH/NrfF